MKVVPCCVVGEFGRDLLRGGWSLSIVDSERVEDEPSREYGVAELKELSDAYELKDGPPSIVNGNKVLPLLEVVPLW